MSINRGGRRGWTRSVLAGFAVAAMAQAAFAVTTVAASGERFTYTRHCDDVVLIVAADMSVLGQYVLSPYVPLAGQSGKGAVAVTVCNGIHLAIDGTPIPDAVLTDLIVAISDPTGGTGETWYAIWQSGNSDPIRAKQAGLGEFGASVTGMTYSSTPASPGTTVTTTSVPWSYSPFAQTATSLNSRRKWRRRPTPSTRWVRPARSPSQTRLPTRRSTLLMAR